MKSSRSRRSIARRRHRRRRSDRMSVRELRPGAELPIHLSRAVALLDLRNDRRLRQHLAPRDPHFGHLAITPAYAAHALSMAAIAIGKADPAAVPAGHGDLARIHERVP